MNPKQNNTLGLIAGNGLLPFLVARGAKKAGLKVVCIGFADNHDSSLADEVDVLYTVPLARQGSWIRKLKKHNISSAIMVGWVAKRKIYTPLRIIKYLPDWRAVRIWYWRMRGKDRRNDTLLCALADELASGGIVLMDSTTYCKDHLADTGTMTKIQPSSLVKSDIDFGWNIVKKLGELDIGQAIIVKEKEVIAVEAIEGTAEMIERASRLCKAGGWTLIKTAKPQQDLRFDVPCIGEDTISALAKAGGKCIVVESRKTMILDRPKTIALADKLGIVIVGHCAN